jgi:hypothetical protein
MYNKNLYSDGTSEDSEGKDSSFESVNDEIEQDLNNKNDNKYKSAKLLDQLKFKQQKYQELIKKTKQKGEEHGKKSTWCTLYYTFFNNFYKKNFVTLNEINLRCRFLWKIDQLEKESQRSKSEQKEYINKPLTNLNEYVNYFSDKKYHTSPPKKQKENKTGEKNIQKKEKNQENNILLNSNSTMVNKNMSKKDMKENNFGVDKDNQNLFQLYGIKKPLDFINKIIKEERKNNNGQNKAKNFDILFSNKKIYEQEIDNYFKMSKESPNNNRIYDEFLDFKSNENFLNDNIGVDLISKYGNKMEEQEKFGNHLNNFYNKIIHNIDPLQKLDEFNM